MTQTDNANQGDPRRARVVVLGEFSAGKSTLINLMTGERSLRTQVTATQMPAVWMSYGDDAPYRVDLNGEQHPVDPSNVESISVDDTAYVRAFMKAPALELCDLIDTPGNSDPNIPSISWERVAELADVAIWCSPSTQAWRQSELAAWRGVPEKLRERSILLLTRADKLRSDEDRQKVLGRIRKEASDLFTHIHMASLLEFENAADVLRDLIKLCNSVDNAAKQDTAMAVHLAASTVETVEPVEVYEPVETVESVEAVEETISASEEAESATTVSDREDMLNDLGADFSDEDIAMTLEDIAATEDTQDTDAALDLLSMPVEFEIPTPREEAPHAQGYATEMWVRLSDGIAPEDTDAMYIAFDSFLEKLDSEFAALHSNADMKEAG